MTFAKVGAIVFYQSCMSSKVVMGVVNTSKACKVFDVKVTSQPIPI